MSWVSHFPRFAAAAATMLTALALPGTAIAGVVVASSGPSAASFPPGRKLPDDAKITLKAADSVTILDAKGSRVLRGAGTFTVGAPGMVTRVSQFATLTRQRSASRVRTGTIRGEDGKPRSPNLWYVDLSRSATFCMIDPQTVRAWRPVKEGVATYTVAGATGSARAALQFTDNISVAPWDIVAAPVADGSAYAITGPGNAATVTVTFAVIANQDYTPEDLAAALLAKGCSAQLDLLATTMALPAETSESSPAAM